MKKIYKKGKDRVCFWSFLFFQFLFLFILAFFLYKNRIEPTCQLQQIASHANSIFSVSEDVLQYLLKLTDDEKNDLKHIDVHLLEKRLLETPGFSFARVRKLMPRTLIVEYTLRDPLFCLYENPFLAVDEEGVVFPISPCFPSLSLPILQVPSKQKSQYLLASCIKKQFEDSGFFVKEIDLGSIEEALLFRKEIQVAAISGGKEFLVRLPVERTDRACKRLSLIRKTFPDYSGTIDLRFFDVAYLDQYFLQNVKRT